MTTLPGDEKAHDARERAKPDEKAMSDMSDAVDRTTPADTDASSSTATRSISARSIRPRMACCG